MSVIKLPLLYVGSKGEQRLYSLFDTGANLSCINPEFVNGLGNADNLGRTRRIATASEGHFIEITQAIRLDFYINDVLLSDATLQKWRIKLDFEHDTVHVDPKVAKMQLI